jgi:hypothetical protein
MVCPFAGRNLANGRLGGPVSVLVPNNGPRYEDLVAHLGRTSPLSPGEAARVVADVLSYFAEGVEDHVRRRHAELKAGGLLNDQIFDRIAAELPRQRVVPPDLSLRQLRRIVYG